MGMKTDASSPTRGGQPTFELTEGLKNELPLRDVIRIAKRGGTGRVRLDKRNGNGWLEIQPSDQTDASSPDRGKEMPHRATTGTGTVRFQFPPQDSFRVMKDLSRVNEQLRIEFVQKSDLRGDIQAIVPKVFIGFGLLTLIRMGLVTTSRLYDSHAPPRPPTPRNPLSRPPGDKPMGFQGGWARTRLKPSHPTIRPGSSGLVTFKDVAGLREAKKELSELVHFLKDPVKYHTMGARIPRGALLSGPPGTGKTLLAKAIAGEAHVPFYSLSGSDFVEMYVGVGASRVRELFAEARKKPEGAIVFIDEIDAIGRARSSQENWGGGAERESTLNQLLIELDGFSGNDNVIIVGATNRMDMLDRALTRPGRFDRTIICELPSVKDRQQILSCHLENVRLDLTGSNTVREFKSYEGKLGDMNEEEIRVREHWCSRVAALTPGFSGADLSNLVNEAAILAARQSTQGVILRHLEESIERTAFGLEKGGDLPTKTKMERTSFHEAGHALIGWVLEHADPPIKMSIVPRKNGVLGYAQSIPDEESVLTPQQVKDRLAVLLGGRVAEMIQYGEWSAGAEDDLQKATSLARNFVGSWGFASNEVGLMSIYSKRLSNITLSDKTLAKMDDAVNQLLADAEERAHCIIEAHREPFMSLARELFEHETLSYREILAVIGYPPKGELSTSFKHYLKHELGKVDSVAPIHVNEV